MEKENNNTSSTYEKGNMKIIVLGDTGVGKTSLIEKFIQEFELPFSGHHSPKERIKAGGVGASKYQKKMQFSLSNENLDKKTKQGSIYEASVEKNRLSSMFN